jgi:small-conductance mechanosensitive channel
MRLEHFWHRFEVYLPTLLASIPVVLAILIGLYVLNAILRRGINIVAHRMHLTDTDVLPVQHVLRWLLRILALILILSVFGFQLGGIWAVISTVLGLIAIGFVAVWSMLSNTSATMLILFMRPYQVGDDIEFAGEAVRGRVIDLNFFFTTLIDHEGHLLQIPNNLIWQKVLKRRRNDPPVSLAAQLNTPIPAKVPLPPPPPVPKEASSAPTPDPLLQVPYMRSIQPQKPR